MVHPETPPITPAQCRAARALLAMHQGELAERANVSRKTITDFEKSVRRPYERTLRDIKNTLEVAGIVFIGGDGNFGPGVRLRDDNAGL
jgi:DNA-binding XRE family transcriptional regulator